MTTKQAYQPKVGDKVRVLVEKDTFGDEIEVSVPHVVDHLYDDGDVSITREDGERYGNCRGWCVASGNLEPWRDLAPSQPQLPQGHVLLRDPSIGDVEREYREVRREAKVGELIKITESHQRRAVVGNTYEVIEVASWGTLIKHPEGKNMRHGGANIGRSEYRVLEPTDIVWIYEGDDVYTRYQLAEAGRVAQVGEKVVVVSAHLNLDYENGDVFEVTETGAVGVIFRDRKGEENAMVHDEYRVLPPIPTVESEVAAANHAAIVDESSDFTALLALAGDNMARHLEQARAVGYREAEETLNPTIAELERQLSIANGQLAQEIEINEPIRQAAMASGLSVSQVAQDIAHVQHALTTQKEAKPTRDEVVEMAKRNVEKVERNLNNRHIAYTVNREGRYVSAKVFNARSGAQIGYGYYGFAPDAVFNVHIAKVIALHIALRQPIPTVYKNAPQPEKAQVGDVGVGLRTGGVYHLVSRDKSLDGTHGRAFKHRAGDGLGTWVGETQIRIIDDSRDGYVYDITRWRSSQQKYRSANAAQTKGGAAA